MYDFAGEPLRRELYRGNVDIHKGMTVAVSGFLSMFGEPEDEIRKATGLVVWIGRSTFVIENEKGVKTQFNHRKVFTATLLNGTNEELCHALLRADEDR